MNLQRVARVVAVSALMLSPFAVWLAAQTGTREDFPGVNTYWRVDATASNGGAIKAPDMVIPELKRRGFKAVINLAGGTAAEAEGAAVRAAGMTYFLIALDPQTLDPAPVEPFLKAVSDPTNHPVFIHSNNGHRGATLWMIKRVLVDAWSIEKAGAEATTIGLINDNANVPRYWQFAREYIAAHSK